MELFAAVLTGVLLALFLWHVTIGAHAKAREKAGKLLGKISRRRPTGLQIIAWGVAAVELVLIAYGVATHDQTPFLASYGAYVALWIVIVAHVSSRDLELREHGVILSGNRASPLVPWSQVRYCKWFDSHGRFFIQLSSRNITFKTDPAQADAVAEVLLPRVELRDETGKVLNPDRKPVGPDVPDVREPRRYQFDLRTLLLFMIVAGSAFAWLGIHLRAGWQEDVVLAEYEKCKPSIGRSGNHVDELNFSATAMCLSDADLVRLKGLRHLRRLDLTYTPITDAGLVHLEPLKQLEFIFLRGPLVTADGVRKLQQALPKTRIVYIEVPSSPTNPPRNQATK